MMQSDIFLTSCPKTAIFSKNTNTRREITAVIFLWDLTNRAVYYIIYKNYRVCGRAMTGRVIGNGIYRDGAVGASSECRPTKVTPEPRKERRLPVESDELPR